jgi:hypothetical protein
MPPIAAGVGERRRWPNPHKDACAWHVVYRATTKHSYPVPEVLLWGIGGFIGARRPIGGGSPANRKQSIWTSNVRASRTLGPPKSACPICLSHQLLSMDYQSVRVPSSLCAMERIRARIRAVRDDTFGGDGRHRRDSSMAGLDAPVADDFSSAPAESLTLF